MQRVIYAMAVFMSVTSRSFVETAEYIEMVCGISATLNLSYTVLEGFSKK